MASTPRWGGLRIEPFDPDARDADGDGIVQEGTAWERPVGLQLVDELGRAIARGQTSSKPLSGLQYVDRQGQTSTYTPTWTNLIGGSGEVIPEKKRKGTGLARLGHPSLKDRGHRSILDMQVAALAEERGPSVSLSPSATEEPPLPLRRGEARYIGKEGAREFIAAHPRYTALVAEDRAREITPNTYYREGLEDEAFTVIVEAQGFDGIPTPVTAEEADELISRGGVRIYRGLPDPEMITQLREGPHYSGRGVDGSGYYFGVVPALSRDYIDKPEYRGYAKDPDAPPIADRMVEAILPPEARIINALDLREELIKEAQGPPTEDLGHIAAMRGYDAMLIPEEESPHPHSGAVYVILNRSILSVGPQPSEDDWEALFADEMIGRTKFTEAQATLSAIKNDPEFRSKTPQEKVDYLRSLISSREEQGLFTAELTEYMQKIKRNIGPNGRKYSFL